MKVFKLKINEHSFVWFTNICLIICFLGLCFNLKRLTRRALWTSRFASRRLPVGQPLETYSINSTNRNFSFLSQTIRLHPDQKENPQALWVTILDYAITSSMMIYLRKELVEYYSEFGLPICGPCRSSPSESNLDENLQRGSPSLVRELIKSFKGDC